MWVEIAAKRQKRSGSIPGAKKNSQVAINCILWKPYCRFGVASMTSLHPAGHLVPDQTANKATIRWRGEKTQDDIMRSSSHFLSVLTLMLLRATSAPSRGSSTQRASWCTRTMGGMARSQRAEDNAEAVTVVFRKEQDNPKHPCQCHHNHSLEKNRSYDRAT